MKSTNTTARCEAKLQRQGRVQVGVWARGKPITWFLLLFLLSTTSAESAPAITGPLKEQISKRDVKDISALSVQVCGAAPWRIMAKRGAQYVVSKGRAVNSTDTCAFAQPSSTGERFRRGWFVESHTCASSFLKYEAPSTIVIGRWLFSRCGQYALVLPLKQKAAFYAQPFEVTVDVSSDDAAALVDSLYEFLTGKQSEPCDDEAGLQFMEPVPLARRICCVDVNDAWLHDKVGQVSVLFEQDKNGSFINFIFEKKNGRWFCSSVYEIDT